MTNWKVWLLCALATGCQEKAPVATIPKKKVLTPIERYLRTHFEANYRDHHGHPRPLPEQGDDHYWVEDSLPVKSLQATLYLISDTPYKALGSGCSDCDRDYVIRDNRSGACFRFYRSGWPDNETKYEKLILNSENEIEPINSDLLGLEAFLNERGVPVSEMSLDTVLRRTRFINRRIHTQSELDSACHYPKAKSVYPLRAMLMPLLKDRHVLLYSTERLPYGVFISYYLLKSASTSPIGPFRFQYNLVHVRLARSLPDKECDPIVEDSTAY